MSEYKVLFVVTLFITSTLAQLGLNEEHRPRKRSGHFLASHIQKTREDLMRGVNCNMNCQSRSTDPVCGTNGRTYDSMCDLERDICKKVKVKLKHTGECSLAEKCEDDRAFRLEQVANGRAVHVPTCLPDGSYAPVQCHNFTYFCWCSTVDGQLIPETIQKDHTPQCLGDRTTAPTPDPPQQDRCKGRNRRKFIENLIQLLVQDHEVNGRADGSSEKEAIKWKFSQLDANNDKVLKRREYRRLRRSVKKYVDPKKCARQFPRFCDTNGDKKITQEEWISCFSLKVGRKRASAGDCTRGRNCLQKSPKPKRPKPSCERDRKLLLEEGNIENNSIPIPECQPDGTYQPIQCHKDICICVNVLTGNSLEGTAVKNGTPDCSKPLPHAREWPGCTGKNKTKFMQDLKKYLLKKANDNESSPATDASSPQSVEEFAAIYHFKHLDKDRNNFLEKKERKDVKKFLKKSPKLRACGKRLAEYCDVDKDHKISIEEWVACVILVPNEGVNSGGGVGGVELRRYGENPLHRYLNAEDEVQYPGRQRDLRKPSILSKRSLNRKHNT